MRSRSNVWMLALGLLVVGIAASSGRGADKMVGRWEGSRPEVYGGSPRVVMYVVAMAGKYVEEGKEMKLGLYNQDDSKHVPNPDSAIGDTIKAFQPGDYVALEWKKDEAHDGVAMAIKVDAYKTLPGEEQPNGYVFKNVETRTENQHDYTFVNVTKFGAPQGTGRDREEGSEGGIGNRSGPERGDSETTEGGRFPRGHDPMKPDLILVGVEPYTPPQTGLIKAIKTAQYLNNRTPAAEIELADGNTVEAVIGGKMDGKKFISDKSMAKALNKFHSGSKVVFRVVDDNGVSVLRDIQAVPKEGGKPTEKSKMASGASGSSGSMATNGATPGLSK